LRGNDEIRFCIRAIHFWSGSETAYHLPRPKAEAFTFASCIAQWQTCNFVPSPPGRCVVCGGADCPHDPHGMGSTGHAWLQSSCWPAWRTRRQAEAVAALAAMGIVAPPPEPPDDAVKEGST
jgi:hypothetical protein